MKIGQHKLNNWEAFQMSWNEATISN